MTGRIAFFVSWVIITVVSLFAYQVDSVPVQNGVVLGALLSFEGNVQFRQEDFNHWLNVAPKQVFVNGNVLATGQNAKAVIALRGQRLLHIDADSQIALSSRESGANSNGESGADGSDGFLVNVLKGSLQVKKASPLQNQSMNEILDKKTQPQGLKLISFLGRTVNTETPQTTISSGSQAVQLGSSAEVSVLKPAGDDEAVVSVQQGQVVVQNLTTGQTSSVTANGKVIEIEPPAAPLRGLAAQPLSLGALVESAPRIVTPTNASILWTFTTLRRSLKNNALLPMVASPPVTFGIHGLPKGGRQAHPLVLEAEGTHPEAKRTRLTKFTSLSSSSSSTSSATTDEVSSQVSLKEGHTVALDVQELLKVASVESGQVAAGGGETYALKLKSGTLVKSSESPLTVFQKDSVKIKLASFADLPLGGSISLTFTGPRFADSTERNPALSAAWIEQRAIPAGSDKSEADVVQLTLSDRADIPRLRTLLVGSNTFEVTTKSPSDIKAAAKKNQVIFIVRNAKPVAHLSGPKAMTFDHARLAQALGADLVFQGSANALLPFLATKATQGTDQKSEAMALQSSALRSLIGESRGLYVLALDAQKLVDIDAEIFRKHPMALRFVLRNARAVFREPVSLLHVRTPRLGEGRSP